MNIDDMMKQMAQFFSPSEMQQLQNLNGKPFDEAWEGMTKIVENSQKLPPQVKMMFTDPEMSTLLKTTIKEIEEKQMDQMQTMQKMMDMSQKLEALMMKKMMGGNTPSPKTPAPEPKGPKNGGNNGGPVF